MFEREPKIPKQSKAIKVNTHTHTHTHERLDTSEGRISILNEQDRRKYPKFNNDRPKIRIYIYTTDAEM